MKDVARRAGVSPKTVSNVINGSAYVSDEIRGRVRTAAAELRYRPNPLARALRNGERTPLTLIVPSPCGPQVSDLVDAIVELAQDAGLSVVTDHAVATEDQPYLLVLGLPAG